jgi:glycosyltransferase involved in cell wall biosynthesis
VRVALIGPLPPEMGGATPGGVATHLAYLATGLAAVDGLDVSVLATNVQGTSGVYVPQKLADWLAPGYLRFVGAGRAIRYAAHLARRRADTSRREVLANLLAYARFLDAVKPDVIHVQHPLERVTYVRTLRTLEPRLVEAPLVVTAHSFFGEHPEALIRQVMAPNLAAASRVIAVSPHIADQAVSLGVDAQRIRVIRSGVDTDRFAPRDRALARQKLGVAESARLVLFVGNLEPRKQLDVLFRALHQIKPRVPAAQLVIVGSGESAGALDQTQPLQKLSVELGLQSVLRFVGRVSEEALLQWYAAADVFVLPSSSEAQGIVALEAMACGLPVVASAVGGLLGTLDDGHTGYLVPSGGVGPLADRIAGLLEDEPRRTSVGVAARERVVREFSWSRAVADTLQVFSEMVACRAG